MPPAPPAHDDLALLADIGGTNCRFQVKRLSTQEILHAAVRPTADYARPADALAAFLGEAGEPEPSCAALAIAGPVTDGRARLTNAAWRFDRDALKSALGLGTLLLVNDLAAQARAVLDLGEDDFSPIGPVAPIAATGTIAVIGPGTGLGVARAERGTKLGRAVTPCEGGHVGFAPKDDVELALLALWRNDHDVVTNEHVVSGPGLVSLYRGFATLEGATAADIAGPEILRRALAEDDFIAEMAVARFARILGSVCGDLALAQGAGEAVLVGDLPNALAPVLARGGFRFRFDACGPHVGFLARTPVRIATAPDLGLRGAAACLADRLSHGSQARARRPTPP